MRKKIGENFDKFNEFMLNSRLFKIPFLNKLYKSIMNKEVILYLIFGFLATVINLLCFYFFSEYIFTNFDVNINITISNIIAFVIAVLFAFITNKIFVFEAREKNSKKTFKEFISFICARLLTFGIATFGILLFVNQLFIHKYIAKIIFNIVEIILNYVFSKFIVFKKCKSVK